MVRYREPTTWELLKGRWRLYRDLKRFDGMPTSEMRPEDETKVYTLMDHGYLFCDVDDFTLKPRLRRTGKRVL
ncbi:MAG: hypothetical protein IJ026_02405 [Candidatus Methanomethylophilaceae archaeon]|nr:hypothetical protein [Candidatus Methanomethylophilaceae archaeon]